MEIIRTAAFSKAAKKLRASAAELYALEAEIVANPEAGDVVQGLKGVRKIRFSYGGKGKRGGGRCVYLIFAKAEAIYLLLAYGKAKQVDLTERQRKDILAFIEDLP